MNLRFLKLRYLAICFAILPIIVNSQSIHINGDKEIYYLLNRISIMNGSNTDIHLSNQHIDRKSILQYYRKYYSIVESQKDKSNIEHFVIDNQEYLEPPSKFEDYSQQKYIDSANIFYTVETNPKEIVFYQHESKPILKYFYRSPGKFFEINQEHFKLTVNPIIELKAGKEFGNSSPIFRNLRGIELSGLIDDKVYFYTNILENQQLFNNYTEDWINDYKAVPGAGLYKTYNSTVLDGLHGWDFLNSQAYVGLKISNSINLEFGHGKHFIGNGFRSLLLSDNSNNYFYLKFNTKIWKLQYQNIFAELSALSSKNVPGDKLIPKKYFAAHYLSYKPWKNIEIGLFETVVFSRENHFEFQYLNPIILYRTVEHLIGSPDNSLLGMNANINMFRTLSLYGQFVMDEFKLSEVLSSSGWWANKFGMQVGLKYYNILGIDQLDTQIEYNTVRPYTYTHSKTIEGSKQSLSNYSNYNQPLAHPRGANFREIIANLRYQPMDKLFLKLRYMNTKYGEDDNDTNWGTNILVPNGTHESDKGNHVGQGYNTTVNMISFDASYEFMHNYYVDLRYIYRDQVSELDTKNINTNYIGAGVRVNIGLMNYDY